MKALTLMIAGLMFIYSGQCASGEWMVGANLSSSQGDTSAGALNRQLADAGLNATASSQDDSRQAWQLLLRHQYNAQWAAEVGYVDLGKVKTSFVGTTADINSFLSQAQDIHPQTANGFLISGLYIYPLKEDISVVFKAGLFSWTSDYKLSTPTVSRKVNADGSDLAFGLGLEYGLNERNMLGFHFNRFSIDGEDIDLIGVGWTLKTDW